MDRLPLRGRAVADLGLAVPPARMAPLRDLRPRKRWTWVGAFSPQLQLCAAAAMIGPVPMRWWAVARPGAPIADATTRLSGVRVDPSGASVRARGARIDLRLEPAGEPVAVASPAGRAWIWTEKRPCIARGTVELGGDVRALEAPALVDLSAGYHDRRTAWRWCAGAGLAADGRRVWWNLVEGIHDGPGSSERTVWVDGEPAETAPVEIARDLSGLRSADGGDLRFSEWAVREERSSAIVMRSLYRQPFGAFAGTLPGGVELAEGFGVMEEHDVVW